MPRVPIDSLDDPRIEPYRTLKETNRTSREGLFITEGPRVTQRLLESPYCTHSVFASEKRVHKIEPHVPEDVPLFVLPHALAELVIGFNFHIGVMGCGYRDGGPLANGSHDSDGRELHLACPNLTDPDNLGSLIRIARAFGVRRLWLGSGCADHLARRTIRVSMGYALFLPIRRDSDLSSRLDTLREERHIRMIGTVLDPKATPLHRANPPDRCCLIFGNEAHGLDDRWQSFCDERWTIPMADGTDSLNVSTAAAIFLHHARFASV